LSENPLLSSLAAAYIDWIRNTPLLLQLFFWYALVTHLPNPRAALTLHGVFISNRGLQVPAINYNGPDLPIWVIQATMGVWLLGVLTAFELVRRKIGRPSLLVTLVSAPVLLFVMVTASGFISPSFPELQGFNF